MKIVDSSGWVEYFGHGPLFDHYRRHLEDLTDIATPTVVMYEVYKRVSQRLGEDEALTAAALLSETRLVDLNRSIALLAAEISIKHKLAMADAIIYATARTERALLVTSDKHFEGLPGVTFIPPPTQQKFAEEAGI